MLPRPCKVENAQTTAEVLMRIAKEQKAFTFLEGLEQVDLIAAARAGGVKFGVGTALSDLTFSGAEKISHFPFLDRATNRKRSRNTRATLRVRRIGALGSITGWEAAPA